MIRSVITDPGNSVQAAVDSENETNALVVATRPLKCYENRALFMFNEDYGIDMNQDASTGGVPEHVHDGIDNVYWTASSIVGGAKFTFNSADQNHTAAGAQSVKSNNAPVGDVMQFDKGADLDCTNYVSLTLWIYVDKNWNSGDDIVIYGYDTDTGLQVGDRIHLQDYFSWSVFDTWHELNIPLSAMGDLATYTTLDALRVEIVAKDWRGPKFYIDDIQFEETGSPIAFTLNADKGTWLHVSGLNISIADAFTGIVTVAGATENATLQGLSYNKFLGETLTAGITYQRKTCGDIVTIPSILTILDVLQLPGTVVSSIGGDGTNAWLTINVTFTEPIILRAENDDYISFTIAEDLTGLLHFRISAGCKIERR